MSKLEKCPACGELTAEEAFCPVADFEDCEDVCASCLEFITDMNAVVGPMTIGEHDELLLKLTSKDTTN